MGNSLATFILFLAPVVVVMLFRRLPVPQALVISLVGGYLLLPTSPKFDLPFFPAYNKDMAVLLPAIIMVLFATGQQSGSGRTFSSAVLSTEQPGWLPRSPLILLCFIGVLISPLPTALANGDPLVFPLRTVPGLSLYDATAAMMAVLFKLLPFLLARKFLADPEQHKTVLVVLCIATLIYSLPTLWEVRMSPRLNSQIYGFFAHDWRQHLRGGGYRPVVFLEHGLRLGLFLVIGLLATALVSRVNTGRTSRIALFGVFWLFATIAVSKNLGAMIIVTLILPAALFLRPRGQVAVAAVFSCIILIYPMMRASNLVPTGTIAETVSAIADGNRVASLNFRLMNEEVLLERARERPVFGWGGWGRARAKDVMGRDISTTDGAWIIEFGEGGWFGYLMRFGLLTLPVLLLALRRSKQDLFLATSGLALMLVANLIDLLPNSSLTPITWIIAGALAGRLEIKRVAVVQKAVALETGRSRLPYSRDLSDPIRNSRNMVQDSQERSATRRARIHPGPRRRSS